ncbi:MAG: nicotinamidase, partial [Bradymonadaceae bacterium]
MPDSALILVDIQKDFMPDGPLPTHGGYAVVPVANRLMDQFDLVVATQDWHPPNHGSFASNHEGHEPGDVIDLAGTDQILWPDHCIQET